MSAEHVGWAFRQKGLAPTRKLVLVALADRCNKDTLRCDPSIRKLMEDTGLARTTVFRALESLEQDGFITKVPRKRENGSDTSCEYRFPGITMVRGESHSDTPPSLTVIPPEPELRTRTEPIAAAPRKRNETWDALTALFGEATTRTSQTLRGKIVRSLNQAGATPDEISERAKRWRHVFPSAQLTEAALDKHWPMLQPPKPKTPPVRPSVPEIPDVSLEQRAVIAAAAREDLNQRRRSR